mgnify:CR=1 FL=1
MLIGLTYDLREDYLKEGFSLEETAEFDRSDTIEAIEACLKQSGYDTDRIGHARQLVSRLARGDRWDLVFNIAEGLYGNGREALVPALLDAYRIPYTFSDPLVLALTLHKGMTKQIVRALGLPTADFAVVATLKDIDAIDLPMPLFAKPVAEGTGKGIGQHSKIASRAELQEVCLSLLAEFKQPVLVETYLSGREFTAGLVGTGSDSRCIGVMEVVFNEVMDCDRIYSYHTKANYEEIVHYRIPETEVLEQCRELALEAWRGLGCRDGGRVDIRMDAAGVPNFIEVNPLAGLHPVHSDLPIICSLAGIPYQQLIADIMESALKRMETARTVT